MWRNLVKSFVCVAALISGETLSKAQIVGAPGSISLTPHGDGAVNRRLSLGMGKSIAIDLPREAKDVMIANPAIANASVRSSTKIFIFGVALGSTNIHVLDADGRQIVGFDVEVGRDLVQIRSTMRQLLPNSTVTVEAIGENIILAGSAANPLEAQKAVEIAARLVGDVTKVVNAMNVRGNDQVHLKVTVAEISRTALKQMGVNLGLNSTNGNGFTQTSNPQFPLTGVVPTNSTMINIITNKLALTSTLNWMETNSLMRTLAEPTLTAISGESAKFLAGGEYPVPTGRDSTGAITITFKPYGVSLVFTPIVMSEGRISLKVGTEVSEISNERVFTVQGITVPGLKVRRADSTVELPSGGTIIMAGMLQESYKKAYQQMPGLGNIPILGALFRSQEFQNQQTELVVMVTPYIVNPVSANALARPDDGMQNTDDVTGSLMGRFNKVYGVQGSNRTQVPAQQPRMVQQRHPSFGHIKD